MQAQVPPLLLWLAIGKLLVCCLEPLLPQRYRHLRALHVAEHELAVASISEQRYVTMTRVDEHRAQLPVHLQRTLRHGLPAVWVAARVQIRTRTRQQALARGSDSDPKVLTWS